MKLRNKKTGDIAEVLTDSIAVNVLMNRNDMTGYYTSLAELNAEWEDAPEEPKEYWFISDRYKVFHTEDTSFIDKERKSFGNYFNTREEAEKVVEKLKAFKRLKDKGFKFIGVRGIGKVIDFDIPKPYNHVWFDEYESGEDEKEFNDDLNLLFGGKE